MKTDSPTAAKAREQQISEIAERASKAIKHVPLEPDPSEPEYASACPLCGTSEPELLMSSHDGTRASGVQIFGIGEDLTELEDFVKWSFEDIPFLLSELAATEKRVREECAKKLDSMAAQANEIGNKIFETQWIRDCNIAKASTLTEAAAAIRSLELKGGMMSKKSDMQAVVKSEAPTLRGILLWCGAPNPDDEFLQKGLARMLERYAKSTGSGAAVSASPQPKCPEHKTAMVRKVDLGVPFWGCSVEGCYLFISVAILEQFAQFFPASLNGEKREPEPAPMEREALAVELFRRHRMRHNGRTRNQSNLLSMWELLGAYERMVWLDTAADVQNVLATPPREGPPFCTAEHPDDFIFCHRPEGHAGNHKNNHINIEWAATTQGTPEGK